MGPPKWEKKPGRGGRASKGYGFAGLHAGGMALQVNESLEERNLLNIATVIGIIDITASVTDIAESLCLVEAKIG